MAKQLLVATKNPGKIGRIAHAFDRTGIIVLTLADIFKDKPIPDVEETGSTFLENARLKDTVRFWLMMPELWWTL